MSASGHVRGTQRIGVARQVPRAAPAATSRRRSRVGAGVVNVEPAGLVDPDNLVMTNPVVPEQGRFCQNWDCLEPVGQGRDGRPGDEHGYCEECGEPFDFRPKLAQGDLVAGQYQVSGPLAYGGFGWLYIAHDRKVDNRPCVLKGLLNTAGSDDGGGVNIEEERRTLAETYHPAIVDIYNFVEHAGQGYLVMEFVGGTSLAKHASRYRKRTGRPLPAEQAAAFLLAVLPAFGYLHDRQRVYCDFKPENVIHVEDAVKLIDLGAVCRLDVTPSSVYGTYGYMAPEVPNIGPSISSDLYTVGRSLAVLILDWPDWEEAERLPPRENHEVLVQHDSLWRFLERACAFDPEERFVSADEMYESLYGVLCQVAAARDGQPRPYTSVRWRPPASRLDELGWRVLPTPRLPNHPRLANRVAGMSDSGPAAAVALASLGEELSWADTATVALAHCELGNYSAAEAAVGFLDSSNPEAIGHEPIIQAARSYLLGVVSLARLDVEHAVRCFDAAFALAPGEAACTLAYASALEATGNPDRLAEAEALYRDVAVTDPSWVAAVAGLARTLLAQDRPAEAARELTRVPSAHPIRIEALTQACRAMERARFDKEIAGAAVEYLRSGQSSERRRARAELAVALYSAALGALRRNEDIGARVGDYPAQDEELALATEKALQELAAATPDLDERYELLDKAARVRPWSAW